MFSMSATQLLLVLSLIFSFSSLSSARSILAPSAPLITRVSGCSDYGNQTRNCLAYEAIEIYGQNFPPIYSNVSVVIQSTEYLTGVVGESGAITVKLPEIRSSLMGQLLYLQINNANGQWSNEFYGLSYSTISSSTGSNVKPALPPVINYIFGCNSENNLKACHTNDFITIIGDNFYNVSSVLLTTNSTRTQFKCQAIMVKSESSIFCSLPTFNDNFQPSTPFNLTINTDHGNVTSINALQYVWPMPQPDADSECSIHHLGGCENIKGFKYIVIFVPLGLLICCIAGIGMACKRRANNSVARQQSPAMINQPLIIPNNHYVVHEPVVVDTEEIHHHHHYDHHY